MYITKSIVYDKLIAYHKQDRLISEYYSKKILESNEYAASYWKRQQAAESDKIRREMGIVPYRSELIKQFRSILVSKENAIGKLSNYHIPIACYVFNCLFDDLKLQIFERTEKLIQLVEKFNIFYKLNNDGGSICPPNIVIQSIIHNQSNIWTDCVKFITNNINSCNDVINKFSKSVNIIYLVRRYIASVYNMRNTAKLQRMSDDILIKHFVQAIHVHHVNCLDKITVWDGHDCMSIRPIENGVRVSVQKGYQAIPDTKPLTPNKANYTTPRWYRNMTVIFHKEE